MMSVLAERRIGCVIGRSSKAASCEEPTAAAPAAAEMQKNASQRHSRRGSESR